MANTIKVNRSLYSYHVAESVLNPGTVVVALNNVDGTAIESALSLEAAQGFLADVEAAVESAQRTAWRARQAEREAARIAAQATQPWFLLTGGHDERGELVHVVTDVGPGWAGAAVASHVPLAEGQRIRDEHNNALPIYEGCKVRRKKRPEQVGRLIAVKDGKAGVLWSVTDADGILQSYRETTLALGALEKVND